MSAHASAVSSSLVIYQVQAGATSGEVGASSQEFVTIYNNGTIDVNVTNWCVTNKDGKAFACLAPKVANQTLYIPSHGYMTIVSEAFSASHTNYQADINYPIASGVITGSSDTVSLIDDRVNVVDAVSWTTSLTGGTALQRRFSQDAAVMVDTDQAADFTKVQGVILPASTVYEVLTIIDECQNMAGLQDIVPAGYMKNEAGECILDLCLNLDGLQVVIPDEYLRSEVSDCKFDYAQLQITELLPNAGGSDIGHEYIEIYNPENRDAFLINYLLSIGGKTYTFPASLKLAPGQYMAFYNTEMTFTFANTTSHASLLGDDGSLINKSDAYDNPKDDISWALIDGVWQYTNQMTFAAINVASILDIDETKDSGLQRCAANQYRHPETNRCRLVVTLASAATACKDGQYRSEETNRCRTIALTGGTLTPCKDSQYRSEETNRCRNLATLATALTPCKDDQYRSEETNRCRNIVATSAPQAAFAVEPIADTGSAFVGWYALGGVGALTLGYGAWEWRREVLLAWYRLASFFTKQ